MIKKPYHLAALAVALSATSNFDNFASALDDHGRGLRGNAMAMANGSVNIDLKGRKPSIDVDDNQHQQRNLKKKQPATTGQVRSKVFLIHHSHLTEILSNSKRSPSPQLQLMEMEEFVEEEKEKEKEVEEKEKEVEESLVLVDQLKEDLEEVEWEGGDESLVVEQLVEEVEEVEEEEKEEEEIIEQQWWWTVALLPWCSWFNC